MFIKYKIILIAKDKMYFSTIMYFPKEDVVSLPTQSTLKKKEQEKYSRKISMLYFTYDLSSQI